MSILPKNGTIPVCIEGEIFNYLSLLIVKSKASYNMHEETLDHLHDSNYK